MGIGSLNIIAGIITTIAQFTRVSELSETVKASCGLGRWWTRFWTDSSTRFPLSTARLPSWSASSSSRASPATSSRSSASSYWSGSSALGFMRLLLKWPPSLHCPRSFSTSRVSRFRPCYCQSSTTTSTTDGSARLQWTCAGAPYQLWCPYDFWFLPLPSVSAACLDNDFLALPSSFHLPVTTPRRIAR